jgi:hypothetical protein
LGPFDIASASSVRMGSKPRAARMQGRLPSQAP